MGINVYFLKRERIVHKTKEMRRNQHIIFNDDYVWMLLQYLSHTGRNVFCQSVILFAANNVDFGEALNVAQKIADRVYTLLRGRILCSVAKYV